MNSLTLVLFRLGLILFGWIPATGVILHRLLVWMFVKRAKVPYGASSRFYTPEDLDSPPSEKKTKSATEVTENYRE